MRCLAILAVLVACSSQPAPGSSTPSSFALSPVGIAQASAADANSPVTIDAATPMRNTQTVVGQGCPASFAAAGGQRCGRGASCDYAEGRCECIESTACSGVVSPTEPRWHCEPRGCPMQIPSGRCDVSSSLKCGYGEHGSGCTTVVTGCINGKWQVTDRPAQPPSTAVAMSHCPAKYGDPSSCPAAPCSYPEGKCRCVAMPPCAGGAHKLGPLPPGYQWQCAPPPNNCPATAPTANTSCDASTGPCSYGYCHDFTSATCANGHWTVEHIHAVQP